MESFPADYGIQITDRHRLESIAGNNIQKILPRALTFIRHNAMIHP
ncbi:hypothetical protein BRYFOR_06036 [Marvinbryantia formatexigens DSM 14469]|uniref:Uncharacterized protein n=1 Tax=Marvinbryantia formatexigens DSM 14469 TaxID=478749 RepID=C6LBP1_9FIRM|nr:hypothetical protein BRYFOR_06036 [Marvinbryantia formatexigens DSM 14469]